MTRNNKLLKLFCILSIVFCCNNVFADKQLHFREGLVRGAYDGVGVISDDLETGTLLDMELEFFTSNRRSWFISTTYAMDFKENVMEYTYLGGGANYYVFSNGMHFDHSVEGRTFKSYPKWRYYVGWQAGISSIVLQRIGEFLQINSFGYDFGGHVGINRKIKDKWGVEFRLSYDVTTGFTTVSVGGWTAKALVGLTYYM